MKLNPCEDSCLITPLFVFLLNLRGTHLKQSSAIWGHSLASLSHIDPCSLILVASRVKRNLSQETVWNAGSPDPDVKVESICIESVLTFLLSAGIILWSSNVLNKVVNVCRKILCGIFTLLFLLSCVNLPFRHIYSFRRMKSNSNLH